MSARAAGRVLLAALSLCAALGAGAPAAWAEPPRVALAPVKAPKKAARDALVAGIDSRLRAASIPLERPKGKRFDPVAAGVSHTLVVAPVADGKRWRARVTLADAAGATVLEAEEGYASKGAREAGQRLGDRLVAALGATSAGASPVAPPVSPAVAVAPPPVVAAPSVAAPPPRAGSPSAGGASLDAPAPSAPDTGERAAPADRDATADRAIPSRTEPAPTAPPSAPQPATERPRYVALALRVGAQPVTRYSVNVGGTPTRLAYGLDPLLTVGAELAGWFGDTGLGAEAAFALTPAKFQLGTDPPPVPADPSARALTFGARLTYWAPLVGVTGQRRATLAIEPLLGLHLRSWFVDEQQPTVVVSETVVAPELGARLWWQPAAALDLGLELRGRWVASFSEAPRVSGQSGSGFGLAVGARARWWFTPFLGLGLDATYHFTNVGLSGAGNRPRFEGDPELVGASVARGELDAALSLVLGY